jgi:hypothetical protein
MADDRVRRPPDLMPASCPRPVHAAACLAALLQCGMAWAQAAPVPEAEPPCIVVVGHGRNLALDDHEANTAWNQVNNRFNAQVAGHVQQAGQRVVRLPLPVESRDMPANVTSILDRAQDAGCDRLLETTIFADDQARTLVVRLRMHPLQRVRNLAGNGALLSIGPPGFSSQRDLPLEPRSFDRLAPDVVAREMAADFVRHSRHAQGGRVAPGPSRSGVTVSGDVR